MLNMWSLLIVFRTSAKNAYVHFLSNLPCVFHCLKMDQQRKRSEVGGLENIWSLVDINIM